MIELMMEFILLNEYTLTKLTCMNLLFVMLTSFVIRILFFNRLCVKIAMI